MRTYGVLIILLAVFLFLESFHCQEDDGPLFLKLYNEIKAIVTPKFPERDEASTFDKLPPSTEVFIMAMPGQSINYNDFEDSEFAQSQSGYDPDVLRHTLVDAIPSRAPYFVDSGRKFSNLYKLLVTNFIDPNNNASTALDETPSYKNALAAIYNADYTFTDMMVYVNKVRGIALDTFSRAASERRLCLLNEDAGICSRKMSLFNQEVRDMNLLYQIGRKYMSSAITSLLATQVRTSATIMTSAYQLYLENERSGVGGRSYLESYMLTKYEPSNFHCWWNSAKTVTNCGTFYTSFSRIRMTTSSADTKSVSSSNAQTFGSQARYSVPFINVQGGTSSSKSSSSIQMSSSSSATTMQFEIAQVKVFRPWLDASVFEYTPLGMVNTPRNFWSDGNFNGICPWYITKLIVAKDIYISSTERNSAFESALSSSTYDSSVRISVGPFKLATSDQRSSSSSSQDSTYDARSQTLSIPGPQIIGYVTTRMPPFPTYDAPKLG